MPTSWLLMGLLAAALWPAAVLADELDASLPDASMGSGGADHGSEENDPSEPCLSDATCDNATHCLNGRCVPGKVRNATCSLAPLLPGLGLGLVLLSRARRSKPGRDSKA